MTSAGVPRPDPRTAPARVRPFRFPPALALLLGALSLFGAAPAAAQCVATDAAITGASPPSDNTAKNAMIADCTALLAAKSTLEGTGGGTLNWARTLAMSSWEGIPGGLESTTRRVIRLDLRSKNLRGTIPDLSALDALWELNLNDNKLTGSIPAALNNNTALIRLYIAHSSDSDHRFQCDADH